MRPSTQKALLDTYVLESDWAACVSQLEDIKPNLFDKS